MAKASRAPEFSEIQETNGQNRLLESLLIVVVLYHQRPDQSSALTSLEAVLLKRSARPQVLIYDNSLRASPPSNPVVTYIHDAGNRGVSAAYNTAAKLAEQEQKTWMLFLDQDTIVTEALLPATAKAINQYPQSRVFVPTILDSRGTLSPFKFSFGRGWRTKVSTAKLPLSRYRFINSGLFVHRATFVKAGGYDEDIPLDFSDISFGDRLKNIIDHFVLMDASLHHHFSDNERVPVEMALARFRYFCKGASVMRQRSRKPIVYLFSVFIRACNLSIHYKDWRFLKQYLQHTNG